MSIQSDTRSEAISTQSPRRRRSPLTRLLDAIGSIWFGVTAMVLVLVYAWVGSAGIPVFSEERFWFIRQDFEKTEMEWFNWWPFHLILALLVLSLILVTVRKIKFNPPNLGVWTIHTGIVILILGCVVYFGRKVEGDMAVYRRQAVLTAPGGEATLVLRPDERTELVARDRSYRVRVADLNPDYELLTGDDKGKATYAAQLFIEPFESGRALEPFIRQLLVGYPEYTEDVIPGRGRAVRVVGSRLVDETLQVELQYAVNDTMHLVDHRALHVKPLGAPRWSELPLRGLPRYREYVSSPNDVLGADRDQAESFLPLSLPAEYRDGAQTGLDSLTFKITGYLPFAHLVRNWEPGGQEFNPLLRFSVSMGSAAISEELLAIVPNRSRVSLADGMLPATFKWVLDRADLERLINPEPPLLRVKVPGRGIARDIRLADAMEREIAIPGSGYTIRGLELYPSWTLAGTGERASMALLRISGPRGSFRRAVVAPRSELSQDLDDEGQRHQGLLDPEIVVELDSLPEAGLVIVGGPVGLHVLLVNRDGQTIHQKAEIGSPLAFLEGQLQVRIDEVSEVSRMVPKPLLIPKRERDVKAGAFYSVIQAEVADGRSSQRIWIPYTHYTHPNVTGYNPMVLTLPDGRQIELLYSRETFVLPTRVALEAFQLQTYPGRDRERDYISLVRYEEDGQLGEIHEVRSNQPSERSGWWFFQATWDPPRPESGHAGMNYTGLGVGNRHGVLIMLLGSAMTVLGTFYAFYIKPMLLRRIRERGRARVRDRAPSRSVERPVDVQTDEVMARLGERS